MVIFRMFVSTCIIVPIVSILLASCFVPLCFVFFIGCFYVYTDLYELGADVCTVCVTPVYCKLHPFVHRTLDDQYPLLSMETMIEDIGV